MCMNNKMTEFKQHPGNHISNISSNKVKVKSCLAGKFIKVLDGYQRSLEGRWGMSQERTH